MKRASALVLVAASLVVCMHSGVAAAPQTDLTPAQVLRSLGWLEGRWRGPTGEGESFEAIYSSPDGGVILSINKSFAGEKVTFVEFERFEVADGAVVMTPFPDGQRACTFTLAEHDATARRAVFTHPTNDFPARIVYERVEADRLQIHVEGTQGGQPMKILLDLRRQG
jgi:hypothetical protein